MTMKAMILNQYGAADNVFEFTDNADIPSINSKQILIRNKAASVNPIDTLKRSGYGREIFSRDRKPEFPYILGCDAVGIVERVGEDVKRFKQGDEVCYISNSFSQGVYAEFGVAELESIVHKPQKLSFIEAATLSYVGVTTYNALTRKAKLNCDTAANKKVLVHAGAGGIGSLAIQLLKHWDCFVATTCSEKNIQLVKSLGADLAIDYNNQDYSNLLQEYDVVLDTLGFRVPGTEEKSNKILKSTRDASYVTITHPFISNFDQKGMTLGLFYNAWHYLKKKWQYRSHRYYWALYKPNQEALHYIMGLAEQGIIKPVIDKTYNLTEVALAHQYLEARHASGKVILTME